MSEVRGGRGGNAFLETRAGADKTRERRGCGFLGRRDAPWHEARDTRQIDRVGRLAERVWREDDDSS